jgi:catechol 2,3-dioxygenase-like lactoylglutathione lyase family enzyme
MKTEALIPIFHVKDVDAAVRYYTEVLGFTQSFRYGTYAGLQFGSHELHITDPEEPRQVVGAGTAYVICDEVDQYFSLIESRGAKIKSKPTDRVYGMHDFAVLDPDGNQLTFGRDADKDA